jgi:hypothetical protein
MRVFHRQMGPLRAAILAAMLLASPAAAAAQGPVGVVEQTLARFDRNTLEPVGPPIPIAEPHAAPVLSPDGERLAVGLSEPQPAGGAGGGARIGLWVVDARRMEVVHRVTTGVAVESLAYPGVVAALTQRGQLLVVDPATGAIRTRSRIGYSHCSPGAVQVGRVAVFVNQVRARVVEVATVDDAGRVRTATIGLRTREASRGCRRAPLVADPQRRRVLVAGASRLAMIDVETLRARRRAIGDSAADRSAAMLRGGLLAVAGERGLRVLDVGGPPLRLRWRDRAARAVYGGGRAVVTVGRGVRARAAATGRLLWRSRDRPFFAAVAAGRVYLGSTARVRVRDLTTGRLVASRPPVFSAFRFVDGS